MNIKQVKRLFLVLAIPFLGLGLWLDEQSFFKDYHQTLCRESDKRFTCISYPSRRSDAFHFGYIQGGLFLWNGARLETGFSEKIVTTGIDRREILANGTFGITRVIGAGVAKVLSTDAYLAGGQEGDIKRRCTLGPFKNEKPVGEWHLSCGDDIFENFRFADSDSAGKYDELEILVEAEAKKYANNRYYAFVGSMLVAPLALLLLLGIVSLLMQTVSFVRFGRKPQEG